MCIGACNPYKMKSNKDTLSAGVKQEKQLHSSKRKLIYLVEPLHESMLCLTWNYDTLSVDDEFVYI